jgi:hypothetical protein
LSASETRERHCRIDRAVPDFATFNPGYDAGEWASAAQPLLGSRQVVYFVFELSPRVRRAEVRDINAIPNGGNA